MADEVINVTALEERIAALEALKDPAMAEFAAMEKRIAALEGAAPEAPSGRIARIEAYLRATSGGLYTGGAGE